MLKFVKQDLLTDRLARLVGVSVEQIKAHLMSVLEEQAKKRKKKQTKKRKKKRRTKKRYKRRKKKSVRKRGKKKN